MSESLMDQTTVEDFSYGDDQKHENAAQSLPRKLTADNSSDSDRSWQDITATNLKTAGTIALLCGMAPVNLSLVLFASVLQIAARIKKFGPAEAFSRRAVTVESKQSERSTIEPLTILISGGKMTKAMQLARYFSRSGHRVVLCEMEKYWHTGHRFSNCVDQFYTVPKPDDVDYADALLNIVRREKVDIYVPVCSPLASLYDSFAIENAGR